MVKGKRIYLVTQLVRDTDAPNSRPTYRLVNASTAAGAVKHVAREIIECEVATTYRVAELAAQGVIVERLDPVYPKGTTPVEADFV